MHIEMIFFIAFIGLLIGSFLNVVIYRLPLMIEASMANQQSTVNLLWPPSHCRQCKQKIKWQHNIPVLSFCYLRGKCKFCSSSISWQYPTVELLTACLSAFITWWFNFNLALIIPALLFTWVLIALTAIDVKTLLLPDELTLSLLWLGLLVNSFHLFTDLESAVWGAAVGYLFLFLLNYFYQLLRKKDGMGGGDFKLLAALGAWVGWQALPILLLISAILALVILILRAALRKIDVKQPIAFGPFLAIAGWLILILNIAF